MDIRRPHDALFRFMFEDEREAGILLRQLLGRDPATRAIAARIDWSRLRGWRTGQLQKRFGALPQSFLDALEAATQVDLDAWCDRILDATTLDEVIRS